jgi:hypothetical protein
MASIEGFVDRSHRPEKREDERVMERTESIENTGGQKIYRGIRNDILMPQEQDEEIRQIYRDLHGSARVVNTWIFTEDGEDLVIQDEAPQSFENALEEYGLDHVVQESVEIFESFADNGYAYCDLAPDNIGFRNGKGLAIDYLDEEAVEPLDGNEQYSAAMTYHFFTKELAELTEQNAETIERKIDRYSTHVEAEQYTGEPMMDFAFQN